MGRVGSGRLLSGIGNLIYRLLGKAILKLYSRKDSLLPYQLGVGSPGGVEPVIRVIERALEGDLPEKYEFVVQLDSTNASNATSRVDCAKAVKAHCPEMLRAAQWAYDEPTPVVFFGPSDDPKLVSSHILLSSAGVRQGDPLAPFLFSLSIRSTISDLRIHLSSFPDSPSVPLIFAYLDDIVILTNDPLTIDRASKFLLSSRSSLSLNVKKSSIDRFDEIRESGIKLLGTAVGSVSAATRTCSDMLRSVVPFPLGPQRDTRRLSGS
jgi:hypothetical protein